MASCDYCNSFILFGGARDGNLRYCNDKCRQAGTLLRYSHTLPIDFVKKHVAEVHQGACPKCSGRGPVDVHKAHRVWSALVLTSWSSSPEMSCKGCAVRRQLGSILFCGVLGWWGFPWGLILTPTQIVKNVIEMVGGPKPSQPSELLERAVRMNLAAQVAQRTTPPPMPTR